MVGGFTAQGCGDEPRHGRPLLRVRILAWPEDVEVPQRDDFESVGRVERGAVLLAGELGGGVRERGRVT